ncbi:MAG TPA: hypothetical protein VD969_23305 [Symbiobacteriaceae bacterium]|nr:hypothetical protein [Symbiobacteriaceae bacterium]
MRERTGRLLIRLLGIFLVFAALPPTAPLAQAAPSNPKLTVAAQSTVGLEEAHPAGKSRLAARPMRHDREGRWWTQLQGRYSARFSPDSQGGYEILNVKDQAIRFVPRNANKVVATERHGYLTYPGLWADADLRLSVTAREVKEEIVLHRPVAANRWEFDMQLRNLSVWSGPSGELLFGPTPEGEVVFEISGLIAEDAAGVQSPVTASVNPEGTVITLSVDKGWLSAPDRQYPVVVDPTTRAVAGLTKGQGVFTLSDGTLIVVGDKLQWRVSKDGGLTWLTPATSLMPPGYTSLVDPSIDIMPDGTVHLVGGKYNVGKSCTNGDYDELYYWRTTLTADRLDKQPYSAAKTLLSICNANTWLMGSEMAAFDAGNYTYVHVAFDLGSQNSNYDPIGYLRYRRVTVTDSTGASSLGSTYSLDTSFVVNGYEIAADRTNGNMLLAYGEMSASYVYSALYWFNRWSGSSYASSSAGTKYNWCLAGDLCGDAPYTVTYDSTGRFQLADGTIWRWKEVTPTSPATPLAIAQAPERSPILAQATTIAPDGRLYVFYGYSNGTIASASWDRATNQWTPYTTLFSSVGSSPLAARIGPPYTSIDLTWGNTTWFARLLFGAPSVSNPIVTGNDGWANTRTPAFTWTFGDPNAGDQQAAFQVVVKDGAGAIVYDSKRKVGTTPSYTLPTALPADGAYSVSVTAWDNLGIASAPSAFTPFTVDTVLPTGSLTINRGGTYTNTSNAYLELPAQDAGGIYQMRFAMDGGAWTTWEAYAATQWRTIPATNGLRTVAVQYRDRALNVSATATDTITLDTSRPTVSLQINSGAAQTANAPAALSVTAVNNPVQMRFKNESDAAFSAWEPYQSSRNWTLTSGWGSRTVTVEVSDLNGSTFQATDQIQLIFEPPVLRGAWGNADHISLQWDPSATSATTGYNVYRSTISGSGYTKLNQTPVAAQEYLDYTATIGTRYFYVVRSVDGVGRESPTASNEGNAVSGAYPVGSLSVSAGSTSGPGGQLMLTARSETAVSWGGVEYRIKGTTLWNLQSGSGSVTPGASFEVAWSVPTQPETYEVRVKLLDSLQRTGQTDVIELTLPGQPAVSQVTAGPQGEVTVMWAGNGLRYDLERSTSASFSTGSVEGLATQTTATRLDLLFNGAANPSLEVTDTQGFPRKWAQVGLGNYVPDTATKADGARSLRVSRSGTTGDDGLRQIVFQGPGLVGKPLAAGFRVKTSAVTGDGIVVRLVFQDREGHELSSMASAPILGTVDWQLVQVSGTVPANTYRIVLEGLLKANAVGTVWFDGAQVQPEKTLATTFRQGLTFPAGYYRVRAWHGPLFNLGPSLWRMVEPFPHRLGLWAWAH